MGDRNICCKNCNIGLASYEGHFDILNTNTSTLHADERISHDWNDYLLIPTMYNVKLDTPENYLQDVGCTICSTHLGWYLVKSRKYVIPPKSLKISYQEENKRFYADIETENRFSSRRR